MREDLEGLSDQPLDILGASNVGSARHNDLVMLGVGHQFGASLLQQFSVASTKHHAGTSLDIGACNFPTETLVCPGDQRCTSFESVCHQQRSTFLNSYRKAQKST